MEQKTEPQQPKHKSTWFYRHKIITSFLVIALFFLISGLFNHNPNQTKVQGVSTSDPTATSTTAPTATDTPTPTDTPVPTLTPTPTAYIAPTQSTIQYAQPTIAQDQGLSNNNYYMNSSGNEVHSPADSTNGSVPAGATAKCNDGTYSFSQHHSGTCSSHGGVAQWL